MGKWITASETDTFCDLAVQNGFKNCQKVRDDANNASIKDRSLKAGDKVYIPDITPKEDSKSTEKQHVYVKAAVPLASIRFVRGGKDEDIKTESAISHLQISNYPTDKAGIDGSKTFAPATKWQYEEHSFADPDTFKIEVSDRKATGATVKVELQSLHPIYSGKNVTGYDLNWSSAAEKDKRKLDAELSKATPQPDQRFRSPYLRLVVDEKDKEARPKQTLLVSDDQPNEENIEILDQKVRATYIIQTCPVAGDAQCRVTAEAKIGGRDRTKKRIKITLGILRQTAGNATVGFNGVSEANIRHRIFRWVRRVYAQADMSPVLVEPKIRFLDPPDRNLLTVSDLDGLSASGVSASGTSPSTMSFKITTVRSDGTTDAKDVSANIPQAASPAARLKPIQVANLIVAEIEKAGFSATAFSNSTSLRSLENDQSADILIRDPQNGKITVSNVISTDGIATLTFGNVNLNGYQNSGGNDTENGSIHERQLLRNYDTGSDRLDCFVVGQLGTGSTRGRAYTACLNMPEKYRPVKEIVNSCVMGTTSGSGAVMDGGNNLPYTFPHELGHALLDCFHTSVRSELMASGGTSTTPAVDGTKRLCDVPVKHPYGDYIPTGDFVAGTGTTKNYDFYAASRLGTIVTDLFEDW